jgi:hypothetical protein
MITTIETPSSVCRFGIARGDITPPVGIYHRMWGAATQDRATGVHRPLLATAVAFLPLDRDHAFVLVTLDHCLFWSPEMNDLRQRVLERHTLAPEQLLVTFSHTHAAGLMDRTRSALLGGELIGPYFDQLCATVAELVGEALRRQELVTISYASGHCDLAGHRDACDESQQWVCGWNPGAFADDTVIAARVTNAAGSIVATFVNYACHPTTLAWQNSLISPDYIGALRETMERELGGLCVFVQGATGDLGPRDGYVGDSAVADRNGRQLAFAALSAIESLPPPRTTAHYAGPVLSGATLGTWEHREWSDERRREVASFAIRRAIVPLPYRADRPSQFDLQLEREEWLIRERDSSGDDSRAPRAMAERLTRAITRWQHCPPGDTFPYELSLLRIGDAVWVFGEGELYQLFQVELRRRFPSRLLVVGMLADGWRPSYLPTRETYGRGVYQEQVALLAPGCLETLIDAAADAIAASCPLAPVVGGEG